MRAYNVLMSLLFKDLDMYIHVHTLPVLGPAPWWMGGVGRECGHGSHAARGWGLGEEPGGLLGGRGEGQLLRIHTGLHLPITTPLLPKRDENYHNTVFTVLYTHLSRGN